MGLFAQDIPVLALKNPAQNNINSIAEFIAEVSLGIKDAFPENHHQNKSNKHSSNSSTHLKVLQFNLFKSNNNFINFESSIKEVSVLHKCPLPIFYKNFVAETNSPPPKA
jgi:hypothetical protein